MSDDKLLYKEESYLIQGAFFSIYKKFGGAFKESIIHNALRFELENKGLKVEDEKRINVYHLGKKIGAYIPDMIIDEKILIELKCKPFLLKEDEKQFWYYLKASEYKVGYLTNFSPSKLEMKRRIYDQARNKIFA